MGAMKNVMVRYGDQKSTLRDVTDHLALFGHTNSEAGTPRGPDDLLGGGTITLPAGSHIEQMWPVYPGSVFTLRRLGSDSRFSVTMNDKGKLLQSGESFEFSGPGKLRIEAPEGGTFTLQMSHSAPPKAE
jgi:hypothetical protein